MKQTPEPGSSIVLHQGDTIEFSLVFPEGEGCCGAAWIRSTVGNAKTRRRELIENAEYGRPILNRDWHDTPMLKSGGHLYVAALPLPEVGRFEAKAFFLPEKSLEPVWPEGPNVTIKVEPAEYCCGNTIYTAFVRLFVCNGKGRTDDENLTRSISALDSAGYTVIPRSGTFRDLIGKLDFIIGALRFRIIQLLPIHPTPTTYARMGRFGSPYAVLDFKDVNPALAEFDRMTTPMDQFQELVDAVHARNARLFLDIPLNHTGWASKLQIEHPEWFARDEEMRFVSPGAWGVTWADLAKLNYDKRELWSYMADVLLFWTRRGVDGFRCDAGYMIPRLAWEYIVAKVRNEYPDTVFLLEGLGGKSETVKELLSDANMDWAYSELFQNYGRTEVEGCLRESIRVSGAHGLLVHYAETHDNDRLAARSHDYARMRTSLAALCSHGGAFGITNGVEWFATEKIDVHGAPSLNFDSKDNQVEHIRRLNAILESHPAFHAGAELRLIHRGNSNCIALLRLARGSAGVLLVLANLGADRCYSLWDPEDFTPGQESLYDLVTGREVTVERRNETFGCALGGNETLCLSPIASDVRMVEDVLRRPFVYPERSARQQARAKMLEIYHCLGKSESIRPEDMNGEVEEMLKDPAAFCGRAAERTANGRGVTGEGSFSAYAPVVSWKWPADLKRVVMVPPGHFLCVSGEHPFAAELTDGRRVLGSEKSIRRGEGSHFALFPAQGEPASNGTLALKLTVFEPDNCRHAQASVLFLCAWENSMVRMSFARNEIAERGSRALCRNSRGGMALVRGVWADIRSQYDCILAGNIDDRYPVDRRVMFTRCRAWMVYEGYSQAIDGDCLDNFSLAEDGTVIWRFTVSAGQGRRVSLEFDLKMRADDDAVGMAFRRRKEATNRDYLENDSPVKLILRPDIEDRINHEKTKAYKIPESAWFNAVGKKRHGFLFSPSTERRLLVDVSRGEFVPEPEWIYSIAHPEDAERGFDGCSDLFSPGYFTFVLKGGESAILSARILVPGRGERSENGCAVSGPATRPGAFRPLNDAMREAMRSFIVKRGEHETVIAGYPWFLDWGRDALICLRGIMAAGMIREAREVLKQFGRFESQGTLPNALHGGDDADRNTSDAPLWFCVACADVVRGGGGANVLETDCGGRSLRQVVRSIIDHYIWGAPNGVGMDGESGLIFSPAHFTWMDTNYPAATPREGYPVEIQALWHAALAFAAELEPDGEWRGLADRVRESIMRYFARSLASAGAGPGRGGWLSDCLHAAPGGGAGTAVPDDALRPNQLLAVTLGALVDGEMQCSVSASCEELLTPGALRSLADRPVSFELPVAHRGNLLNDPSLPYWGRYEGEEDTRRKPAYHNGTAWTWLFPSYCEALFMAHGEPARQTALSILSSSVEIINRGCVGHVPEITDGDRPHELRGCGAQAWGATELYRVLAKLGAAGRLSS